MEKKNTDEKKDFETPKIEDKDGLNIAYDPEELKKFYPHLIYEISDKKQSVNIESVEMKVEKVEEAKQEIQKNSIPNELVNPGAIDFIRRCKKKEEAIEIIDYLLKRKEITPEEGEMFKKQISEEGGLKKLIDESGGLKKPGYYLDKYYKKNYLYKD